MFGMDSVFTAFWHGLFDIYHTLIIGCSNIITFFTANISDIIGDNLIGNLVGLVVPDLSLMELMFGTGIFVFIGFVLVKFFIGIVTG